MNGDILLRYFTGTALLFAGGFGLAFLITILLRAKRLSNVFLRWFVIAFFLGVFCGFMDIVLQAM